MDIMELAYYRNEGNLMEEAELVAYRGEGKIEDLQECFLGYDKEEDTYYMGFDTWYYTEGTSGSAVVTAKLHPEGYWYEITLKDFSEDGLFYDSYQNLVEKLECIRLD